MIKLAIMNHHPGLGGAETSLLTFLRKIDRKQFDVTVILPDSGPFSRELHEIGIRVKVIHLPRGLILLKRGHALKAFLVILFYLFSLQIFLLKLCAYLRKNRFDFILTNSGKAHLYGSLAALFCSIPIIWRFHDVLSPEDFSPLLIRGFIFLGNRLPRKVLAVSKTARDYLLKNGLKSDKVEVIFSGIDKEKLEGKNAFEGFREEWHLQNGVKLVGCMGRIIPQKGQKSFLLAIPKVIDQYPETFFLLIGDLYPGEGEYKEELLGIVKKMGMEDKVKFTGFRREIGDAIRSLDIVVFPSVAPESFGLAILEAMVLGKPVIASNLEGVRELIEDGVTGFLTEPGSPEQIADRIIDLLGNKDLYDRIRKKALEQASRFPVENYVASMERAFREAALKER